jgi:hypothetical protein
MAGLLVTYPLPGKVATASISTRRSLRQSCACTPTLEPRQHPPAALALFLVCGRHHRMVINKQESKCENAGFYHFLAEAIA